MAMAKAKAKKQILAELFIWGMYWVFPQFFHFAEALPCFNQSINAYKYDKLSAAKHSFHNKLK